MPIHTTPAIRRIYLLFDKYNLISGTHLKKELILQRPHFKERTYFTKTSFQERNDFNNITFYLKIHKDKLKY